ncbi:MAG: hypothetical protein ABR577_08335 [Pyrinomonadaceae bacterium]
MLKEFKAVKQHDNDLFRRWFEDDFFDLIVWYDAHQMICGFQLCYDKNRRERAITWLESKGYAHDVIDSGERSVWEVKSPTLAGATSFPHQQVLEDFTLRSTEIDEEVAAYVKRKLEEYREPDELRGL